MKKKYFNFILTVSVILAPLFIFLYEVKKIGGIQDLFDIEDDNEL